MSLLVLGATGMLGRALLREAAARGTRVTGLARSRADICLDVCDDRALASAVEAAQPKVIINAAAVTNLSDCEKDPAKTYLVNARVVSVLTEICSAENIYLVQISTDHYFTGDLDAKHTEESPVRLVNEYARTKYAGETFALTCPGALVVRTNVVGFRNWEGRPTFVEWAISSLRDSAPVTLFTDVYTSSIDVAHFSAALLDLLEKRPSGILNLASREVFSKKDFVEALARRCGLSLANVRAGSERGRAGAHRAESAGLDVRRAENLLGSPLPSLADVVEILALECQGGVQCSQKQ